MVPPILYYGTALKKAKWLLRRGFTPKTEEHIYFAVHPITSIWFAERASNRSPGNGPTIVSVNTEGVEHLFTEEASDTWYTDKPIPRGAVKIFQSANGFASFKKRLYAEEAKNAEVRNNPASLISVIPYRIGSSISLKKMWRQYVLKKGFEGLVVTEQQGSYMQVQKVKTLFTVDAAVIAMNTTGKTWSRGMFGSLLLGLMDKKGRILEIGDMSGGDFDFKTRWRKKLQKDVTHNEDGYAWVTPKHVFEVRYLETLPASKPHTLYKIKGNRLREIGPSPYKMFSLRSPSFVRVREDKSVNIHDIRIEQIPELVGGSGRRLLLKNKMEDNPYPVWNKSGKVPTDVHISIGSLAKIGMSTGQPILVHDAVTAKKVVSILKSAYGVISKITKHGSGYIIEYQ